jgi:hypothetical protein
VVAVRRLFLVGAAFLVAIEAASVAFPHAMLSPGDVSRGHHEIEGDCFACHAPFQGPDERCVTCHEVSKIKTPGRTAFHFALLEKECSACHTDHEGRSAPRSIREFRHDLLRADVRDRCGGCHSPPADPVHVGVGNECGACHRVQGWKPSTFDHARSFRFDRDHPADCKSCHPSGFESFTCYGCHEHAPAEVGEKHRKEGIPDFEDCARCHRSGDQGEVEGAEGEAEHRGRGGDR